MTEDALDLPHLLEVARHAAAVGSAEVRSGATQGLEREIKGRGDYVTDTDRRSEKAILEVLAAAVPRLPVLAEESGGLLEQPALWVVDPLDGTTNFVHAHPAVGISVALVVQGEPVVGVVRAPVIGSEFTAVRGGGARLNGRPMAVSRPAVTEALVATGFPFRAPDLRARYLRMFGRALDAFEDMRRVGAASLDLAWTAAGVFDGFFELGLSPWDVAAGALLLREAGGAVSDWDGGNSWLRTGDILAGSPAILSCLQTMARETR
jgi:myo-inositol-1(or 4)-monophosphatase